MNRVFRVHGPRGVIERAGAIVEKANTRQTNANRVPVVEIMSRHVVCALQDLPLETLIAVMIQERLGCVPVVDDHGHPLGMVTKFDLVQLLATSGSGAPLVADVMMPIAISIEQSATVAHAAALMASEDMHHVMIVRERQLVGVVSTMDVTRWLANEYKEGAR